MKVNKNFKCYILFFCHQKTIKNRQALHEVIRASSLHKFCWIFFQTCRSHHGYENFQIYGKLQFLEDVLTSQNIDSRYFYLYAATTPPIPPIPLCSQNSPPNSFMTPQLTMTWSIRLFIAYVICNFSNVKTLQFCKQNICNIAW